MNAKVKAACEVLGEKFAKGLVHGCGSVGCCLEFEIEKGEASDFEITRKPNRPYVVYKEDKCR